LPGLTAKERADLAAADDLIAPPLFRELISRHAGRPAEQELRAMRTRRAGQAAGNLAEEVAQLLDDHDYKAARTRIDEYVRRWTGTGATARMRALEPEIGQRQADEIDVRLTEANELLAMGRYQAAREALRTDWPFESVYRERLEDEMDALERRIRVHEHESTRQPGDPATPRPVVRREGQPGPPPALPGLPHPDLRRLDEARKLVASAKKLFEDSRFEPAAKALSDLLGFYPDLPYVQRNHDAIEAVRALSRHRAEGLGGLLHATNTVRKGKRVILTYRFTNADEELDWEELSNIPHKDGGRFEVAREGVRGNGVMSYLHRAFFKNNVSIRCEAHIQRPRTHGLGFCQQGTETRMILLLATNHWFVEGENYVLERPGHSLLMIGKGTNADVPVDSPDIGFIFEGATKTKPNPPGGSMIRLRFGLDGNRMKGSVTYKSEESTLPGEAVGDDGRGIERVRPTLFVVQNSVLFREIVIEGVLHPDWEKERVRELLSMAEMLE
jgi:hypothetical protein